MNKTQIPLTQKLLPLTIFSVFMGLLEAVVVVYLRQMYYPEGFSFPLHILPPGAISVEMYREISTLVMLACVGYVSGKIFLERIAYFLFCFGIWDIFYYIWLKVFLDWPPSLFTWDILFLVPFVWTGPVLAPVICALTMVILSYGIIHLLASGGVTKFGAFELILCVTGAVTIFLTFIWDFAKLSIEKGVLAVSLSIDTEPAFRGFLAEYIPTVFPWLLFWAGECLILCSILLFFRRNTA
jgi:hypothetical protein